MSKTKLCLKIASLIIFIFVVLVGIKITMKHCHVSPRRESGRVSPGRVATNKYGKISLIPEFSDGLKIKTTTIKNSDPSSRVNTKDIYGYEDISGRMIIDYKFDFAKDFSEGLAAVNLNDKWGYIDTKGKLVIPLFFEWADSFSEGLAAIELNSKRGYINKKGEIVIPPFFEAAQEFSEGFASVQMNKKWGYIDTKGELVIPPQYCWTYAFLNGIAEVQKNLKDEEMIYIDKTGAEVPEDKIPAQR